MPNSEERLGRKKLLNICKFSNKHISFSATPFLGNGGANGRVGFKRPSLRTRGLGQLQRLASMPGKAKSTVFQSTYSVSISVTFVDLMPKLKPLSQSKWRLKENLSSRKMVISKMGTRLKIRTWLPFWSKKSINYARDGCFTRPLHGSLVFDHEQSKEPEKSIWSNKVRQVCGLLSPYG